MKFSQYTIPSQKGDGGNQASRVGEVKTSRAWGSQTGSCYWRLFVLILSQRETEKVIALRAKKETLAADVEATKTKVEDLTKGIADTRSGVTDVKSFIDGMRSSRDTKVGSLYFMCLI